MKNVRQHMEEIGLQEDWIFGVWDAKSGNEATNTRYIYFWYQFYIYWYPLFIFTLHTNL